MKRNKYPINQYHINSEENPCCCFQVTRRIIYAGAVNYEKFTVFLPKEQNTLGYLCFESDRYKFWDEYVAVWKIKSFNQSN